MPLPALSALRRALSGTHMLAALPLLALAVYQILGELGLLLMALFFPAILAATGALKPDPKPEDERDPLTGLMLRDGLIEWAEKAMIEVRDKEHQVAVVAMTIDDLDLIEERFGRSMRDTVLAEACDRLKTLLRDDDVLARLGPGFALGLKNVRTPETETLMTLAERLQSIFEEPFCEGPTRTYCSLSIGLAAEAHVKGSSGSNVVIGAHRASELAAMSSAGSIRVYNDGLASQRAADRDVARDLANALEIGEISAWFQPQIAIDTGQVVGFEALARWDHPERGVVSPASFLADIEKYGMAQRLAEVILKQSLMALNTWDASGFQIQSVSVNFSSEELRNPRLPDFVRWELDRHDLTPNRLIVEVLESVAADSSEDVISRTLNTLSRIGCRIDLDDFGTGFTSFVNIRRFDVSRIKIDRSLVSQVDHDETQKRMFAALLAFSEKLGIETLAEGVETEAEVSTLRKLGCRLTQGFHFARPMPLGDTLNWLEDNGQLAPYAEKRSA